MYAKAACWTRLYSSAMNADWIFYAINRDYPEEEKGQNNHYSRKLKADLFIDDRNLGGLPDWGTIYEMVHQKLSYEDLMRKYEQEYEPEKPKGFFARLMGK